MNTQVDGATEAPQRDYFTQMMSHENPRVPHTDPTTRPRAKGVGRRELQRKAEAAVTKPAAPAIPIRSPPTGVHPQVVIPTRPLAERPPSADAMPVGSAVGGQLLVPTGPTALALAAAGGNVESSAPGSMHDSADDESELSELDDVQDEVVVRPMFPNLNKADAGQGDNIVVGSSAATPEPGLPGERREGGVSLD